MKTIYIIILSLFFGSTFCACSDDKEDTVIPDEKYEPHFSGSMEGFGYDWLGAGSEEADSIHIYAVKDDNLIVANAIYLPQISTQESEFIAEETPISLTPGNKYTFYSYRAYNAASPTGTEGIAIELPITQEQQKGDDMTHIHQYDFIYAKTESNEPEINFQYKHAFALLEFELPAGIRAITLNDPDPDAAYGGFRCFSLEDEAWSLRNAEFPYVNLSLEEPTGKNGEKAWMVIFPGHEGKPFELIVQTEDYTIYRIRENAPEEGFNAGQKYSIKVDLEKAEQVLTPPTRTGDTWQIYSARDLEWFRDNVNCGSTDWNAILRSDIDLKGNEQNPWRPISTTYYYTGHFDGDGHSISGVYISNVRLYAGLWDGIDAPACIENLRVSGEIISDRSYIVGSIVAVIEGGIIRKCHSEININVKKTVVAGGLAGENSGQIQDCYYSGDIQITESSAYIGFIIGQNYNLVEYCYATGNLNYDSSGAGGICGGNLSTGILRNCVSLRQIWNETGDLQTTTKGRIIAFNQGRSYNNIAHEGIDIGNCHSNNVDIQGISKSWEECTSPAIYLKLGWSPEIWGLEEGNIPYLKVLK